MSWNERSGDAEIILVAGALVNAVESWRCACICVLLMASSYLLLQLEPRRLMPLAALFLLVDFGIGGRSDAQFALRAVTSAVLLHGHFPSSLPKGTAVAVGLIVALLPEATRLVSDPLTRLALELVSVGEADLVVLSFLKLAQVSQYNLTCAWFALLIAGTTALMRNQLEVFSSVLAPANRPLLQYWSLLVLIGVYLIHQIQNRFRLHIARKLFHFLAFAIFIPGIQYNPSLLFFCAVVALEGFISLEFLRNLSQFSFISTWYENFLDSRDSGEVALSHMFLLFGCSVTVLLESITKLQNSGFLGVLVLCIGDSFAAIIGSKYGQHKLMGGAKSLEGMVANCVTMGIAAVALGLWSGPMALTLFTASAYEAYTSGIDNFSLPLFAFSSLTFFTLNSSVYL